MIRALSLVFVLAASAAQSEELRIMNWNIANLASEVGVSLREGSHSRKEDDFLRIREIIAREDADIIALQEVGSIAAAQKALGPEYEVTFESRCTANVCAEDHGNIYTAIAHKADLEVADIDPSSLANSR